MIKAPITSFYLSVVLSLILPVIPTFCADCNESFMIGDRVYPVSPRWCGRKIDSLDAAVASSLVSLADELTFEDYRIYVRPEVKEAFAKMAEAAARDSIRLIVDSGYRSPAFQKKIIQRRLEAGGKMSEILAVVAPPGYSEHETGRAVDLVPSDAGFALLDAYRWLRSHAARFGFRESYPASTVDSIAWEPWHWIYTGCDR